MKKIRKNKDFKKKKSITFRRNVLVGVFMLIACTIAGSIVTFS